MRSPILTHTLLPAFLFPVLLVLPGPPRDEVRLDFRPEPDGTLRFEISSKLDFETVHEGWMGDDEDEYEMGDGLSMKSAIRQRAIWIDKFEKVESGVPLVVVRSFETLEGESTSEWDLAGTTSDSIESEYGGNLEGHALRFTREAADSAWTVEPAGENAEVVEAEWYEDLESISWFQRLLPSEPVEVGATWSPDEQAWLAVEDEFGGLPLNEDEGFEDDPDFDAEFAAKYEAWDDEFEDKLRESSQVELRCTLASVDEVDGVRIARIELEVEQASEADHVLAYTDEDGDPTEEAETRSIEFAGTATLLWNLDTGRPHSFELEGKLDVLVENETTWSTPDGPLEASEKGTTTGRLELKVEVSD